MYGRNSRLTKDTIRNILFDERLRNLKVSRREKPKKTWPEKRKRQFSERIKEYWKKKK